jgi:hypothetical protein
VFALVIFYAITKNRWRWARALIALIVLTSVVIGGLYFWKQLPPTISPQAEYAGIRLGMGPDEVLSINGSPPAVYREAAAEKRDAENPPSVGVPGVGGLRLSFAKKRVTKVTRAATSFLFYDLVLL